MNIAIIGAGNVGGNLGRAFAKHDHDVRFGVRDPNKIAALVAECGGRTKAVQPQDAAAGADVVFLTVPWGVALDVVTDLGKLDGTILVDCTNPVAWQGGITYATDVPGASGAQSIAARTGAQVVKAFSTHGAELIVAPRLGDVAVDEYICGDDAQAKATVGKLIKQIGLNPVDVGPLRLAAQLEHLAVLWIHLAIEGGAGRNFAFKMLRG